MKIIDKINEYEKKAVLLYNKVYDLKDFDQEVVNKLEEEISSYADEVSEYILELTNMIDDVADDCEKSYKKSIVYGILIGVFGLATIFFVAVNPINSLLMMIATTISTKKFVDHYKNSDYESRFNLDNYYDKLISIANIVENCDVTLNKKIKEYNYKNFGVEYTNNFEYDQDQMKVLDALVLYFETGELPELNKTEYEELKNILQQILEVKTEDMQELLKEMDNYGGVYTLSLTKK